MRKLEWNKILNMYEHFTEIEKRQVEDFMYWFKNLEYNRKQIEYANRNLQYDEKM